jgi:hypothetical protein
LRPVEPPPSGSIVASLVEEGFAALRRGEPDGARRAWTEALWLDPGNRVLALNLRRLTSAAAGQR